MDGPYLTIVLLNISMRDSPVAPNRVRYPCYVTESQRTGFWRGVHVQNAA